MSPFAAAAHVLDEHWDCGGYCYCGWGHEDDRTVTAHQVDMLAAAGLLPTTQEWGVKHVGSGGSTLIYRYTDEDGARAFLASIEFHGRPGMVVTRWVGATEWTTEEGKA